ncbi:MAG: hypothetical protein Q8P50_12575 [Bacillota bacterium]|nr:hypothetical protein [Bacillota bacterium]
MNRRSLTALLFGILVCFVSEPVGAQCLECIGVKCEDAQTPGGGFHACVEVGSYMCHAWDPCGDDEDALLALDGTISREIPRWAFLFGTGWVREVAEDGSVLIRSCSHRILVREYSEARVLAIRERTRAINL